MKTTARLSPALLAAVALCCIGCNYHTLRFRPTDTTSQRTVEGVNLQLSRDGGNRSLGASDPHGQIDTKGLKSSDRITFSKPGYRDTLLYLGVGDYSVEAPAGSPKRKLEIVDTEVVPVPMHRAQ